MEDLKQIQEFFSKPLNEISKEDAWKKFQKEKSVTDKTIKAARKDFEKEWEAGKLNENSFVEAFKFEKALKGMGYDVKVKYLDDFGKDVFEIYFNNPSDADESIFYDAKKLGYDNVRVFANPQESVKEDKKLTYNDFVRMVRDDMMAGAAPDERPSEELVGKRAKAYYNDYLQGASVDDLFEATKEEETEFHTKLDKLVHDTFGKRKGEMEEYNTGIYYDPAKDNVRPKAKEASKTGLEKVKDMIKKIMKEDLADFEEKEADYDDLYSDYLYKMVKEVATEKGYSKFLVSKDNPKGETSGLDTKTMNKILMNVIKDLDELKQLGEGVIEEELCPKGKAYIKKRQAAGEKSSAYLSGRAVKVCKGQMKG